MIGNVSDLESISKSRSSGPHLFALSACQPANYLLKMIIMSLLEIQIAIKRLPKEELKQFDQWYETYLEEQWDEQIRQDIRSGKLDALRSEVSRAKDAGTLRTFP